MNILNKKSCDSSVETLIYLNLYQIFKISVFWTARSSSNGSVSSGV